MLLILGKKFSSVRTKQNMVTQNKGISLVEMLVGISIISMVFVILFASFQSMLTFAERNRLRANALMLANEHIEVIRALPFDSIGTVAGLPSGTIPQLETITYGNHAYTRRTFIQYVDDPADGLGVADTLTADYKRVKVEIGYVFRGATQTFSLVTTMAPKSQESLAGAGILRINVVDATNDPVPIASVHILNTTVATSVDISTFTNADGTISFPGAWAGGGYEIYISKSGYSSAQTYISDVANPNPTPSPYNVAENSITEVFFKIDLLSSIHLLTRLWPVRGRFFDNMNDSSQLSLLTDTEIVGGALTLGGIAGSYNTSGKGTSVPISPASLGEWLLFSYDAITPPNTSVSFQIEYDTGGGVFALIPDTDIPNNSTGLATSPIDLGGLDTTTYSSLRIVSTLTSSDSVSTPEILEYTLSYHEPVVPVANVPFTLTSGTTIGTDASSNPIYKYATSGQTDATGEWLSGDMEFDSYELIVPSHHVAEACPSLPLILEPDTDLEQILTLTPATAHSLSLQVTSPLGSAVARAEVRIVGGSLDTVRSTGSCGTAYFPALSEDSFNVSIKAPGFAPFTTTIAVSGQVESSVTLSY
ncbi:MAG: hypothetical protein UU98_C0026G0016 [Parcubacteria group bacterium GW2011_GWD2_42_14]|nr:MAG: hypothetical protein UU98_C0026G0016 [Parcubacteria group bacterium GW2011_GWD2_42_14]